MAVNDTPATVAQATGHLSATGHAGARAGRLKTSEGYEIHYEVAGGASETLLCLHGGPGANSRYLHPLADLADGELQVVFYDQLGSGLSEVPSADYDWTVERFVRELDEVRQGLGLGRVHLLGQSWGGCLALQYALDYPEGIATVVLSNTSASIPQGAQDMTALRLGLGAERYATMLDHEARGQYNDPEYQSCVDELNVRHLWRTFPWSRERGLREFTEMIVPLFGEDGPAYAAMWGPNEFHCTGSLQGWDITHRLREIVAPTLILCGYYDEVSVDCHRVLAAGLRDNEFVIFGNSSHLTFLEREAAPYLAVVRDFVQRHKAEG